MSTLKSPGNTYMNCSTVPEPMVDVPMAVELTYSGEWAKPTTVNSVRARVSSTSPTDGSTVTVSPSAVGPLITRSLKMMHSPGAVGHRPSVNRSRFR